MHVVEEYLEAQDSSEGTANFNIGGSSALKLKTMLGLELLLRTLRSS